MEEVPCLMEKETGVDWVKRGHPTPTGRSGVRVLSARYFMWGRFGAKT